jgi:hypothetical protein
MVKGFGDQWESIDNRPFTLQTAGQTMPVIFFNNQPGTLVPVTFQVDMSAQVLAGAFDPLNDTIEAWGSFQQPSGWAPGFLLTNSPTAPNPNLYSGTYDDPNASGTREEYKFHISGSHYTWERPATTGGDNRSFVLSPAPQVLPTVFFNDEFTSDLLWADTVVTFSVDMNNAHGTDGTIFDPEVNSVYLNGDFLGWPAWAPWGSPNGLLLARVGTSLIYTTQALIPRGSTLALTYKYSIDWLDNEAGFKMNHVRYIRTLNACNLPQDTFGVQTVEPIVGTISAAPSNPGHIQLSWNGRPGVHLQSATDLNNPVWIDHFATDGLSLTNYPRSAVMEFFRLVKP